MKEDVVILAEAILEHWQYYDNGDYSPTFYSCEFCTGHSIKSYEDVEHTLDCPVLVAKDVMTGR